MLVKTISAGAVDTFQINYVPEYCVIVNSDGSKPESVDGFKCTVLGDGVLSDLDNSGILRVGTFAKFGVTGILIPLADGLVGGKVVDFVINNTSNTKDILVYMPITSKGTTYIQTLQQTVLANSQTEFKKFSALFFVSADQITVDYEDGASHTFSSGEISLMAGQFQSLNYPVLNNLDGVVKKATVLHKNDTTVYLMRYQPIGNM